MCGLTQRLSTGRAIAGELVRTQGLRCLFSEIAEVDGAENDVLTAGRSQRGSNCRGQAAAFLPAGAMPRPVRASALLRSKPTSRPEKNDGPVNGALAINAPCKVLCPIATVICVRLGVLR